MTTATAADTKNLVARAEAIASIIAEDADESERDRRLTGPHLQRDERTGPARGLGAGIAGWARSLAHGRVRAVRDRGEDSRLRRLEPCGSGPRAHSSDQRSRKRASRRCTRTARPGRSGQVASSRSTLRFPSRGRLPRDGPLALLQRLRARAVARRRRHGHGGERAAAHELGGHPADVFRDLPPQ